MVNCCLQSLKLCLTLSLSAAVEIQKEPTKSSKRESVAIKGGTKCKKIAGSED
jgi:hypothetical protein